MKKLAIKKKQEEEARLPPRNQASLNRHQHTSHTDILTHRPTNPRDPTDPLIDRPTDQPASTPARTPICSAAYRQ